MPLEKYPNLHLLNDRIPLESNLIPKWVKEEITVQGLLTTQKDRVSFCGIIANRSDGFVFLPRSMEAVSENKKHEIAGLLASAILKYEKQNKVSLKASDIDEGMLGCEQLSIIHELLDDFRANGAYGAHNRVRTVNTGKTDWKRTISRVTPFPSSNGVPIYPVLLGSCSRINQNTIIAEIHTSVIAKLISTFGWWFYKDPLKNMMEVTENIDLINRTDFCISLLRKELVSIYSDRNIRLIKNLIKYLAFSSKNSDSRVVIGLRDFHWAWEHMLSAVLNRKIDLSKSFPYPVYHTTKGDRLPAPRKSMRTDIILENAESNKVVVVDAKYYDATTINSSPSWPDLIKQFFYAKAIQLIRKDSQIENVFIFPGDSDYMHSVSVESKSTEIDYDNLFPRVWCFYVKPSDVMNNYVSKDIMTDLSDLLFAQKT